MTTETARTMFPKGTRVRWSTYHGTMHWAGTSTGRIIPNANGDCMVKVSSDQDNGRDPVSIMAESLIRDSFIAA